MRTRPLLALLAVAPLACGVPAAQVAQDSVEVTIPRGASLRAAAETLAARGVVASPTMFRFYAALTGRHRAVRAGTYVIPRGASTRDVLAIVVAGRPAERRLVIPEGRTLREIAVLVEEQLGIPADSFASAARDSALRTRLGVPTPTLEGYLYPSSYHFRIDATARDVVRRMVHEFEARWRPTWNARLDTLGLSRHELVTLASIIEGEVRYPPDREYVSSVYHNRLRRGMRLQADPTVVYALGRRRRLFEKDYALRSPYNTYQIDGLPPGPVGSPSEASLLAALYPARTNFLYLVARPDGKHIFSRTYAEHRRAVRAVRRLESEEGGR